MHTYQIRSMSDDDCFVLATRELQTFTARFNQNDPTLSEFYYSSYFSPCSTTRPRYFTNLDITSFIEALEKSQSPLWRFIFSSETPFTLTANDTIAIASTLLQKQQFFRLETLALNGLVHVNTDVIFAIAQLLTTTTMPLTTLSLAECPIGDDGLIVLVNALEHENSKIRFLSVSSCNIGNRGFLHLIRSLERGNSCVNELEICEFAKQQRTIGAYASGFLRHYVGAMGNRMIQDIRANDNHYRQKLKRRFDWAMHRRNDTTAYTYETFFDEDDYTGDERDDNYATDEEDEI